MGVIDDILQKIEKLHSEVTATRDVVTTSVSENVQGEITLPGTSEPDAKADPQLTENEATLIKDEEFIMGMINSLASIVTSIKNGNMIEAIETVERTVSVITQLIPKG